MKDPQRRYFIAKRVPDDHFEAEPTFESDTITSIPISLVKAHNIGPRKTKTGAYLDHTILGDLEDFEEFEKMYVSKEPVEDIDEVFDEPSISDKEKPKLVTFNAQVEDSDELENRWSEEKAQWLKQLHVFQRYREMREEHALANWKRHSTEWLRVENVISKKLKKSPHELLMTRLGEYRRFIEERDLIEEALSLLDEREVNFWKCGLRIGNDLLGLTSQMPRGGPRQIERLRYYDDKRNPKARETSEYWKARKDELAHTISALDPFFYHKDAGYMEVTGTGISKAELASAFMDRLDQRVAERGMSASTTQILNESNLSAVASTIPFQEPGDDEPLAPLSGTHILFSTRRLFFENRLDEVSTSVLTLHNRGTVSIHFEWISIPKPNPLKVVASNDGIQRFFWAYTKGTVLPGSAFDFPIMFKSSSPGLYTELWQLVTHPHTLHAPELTVTLQGMAIEPDVYGEKRDSIVKRLEKRRAYSLAEEIIELVLNKVRSTSAKRHTTGGLKHQETFLAQNAELNLRYHAPTIEVLEQLAVEVYASIGLTKPWDLSVVTLHENIMSVAKADTRVAYIAKLNQLVKDSSVDISASLKSMRYVICYDILVGLSLKIPDVSDEIRKRLSLPLQRSAANFSETDEVIEEPESQEVKPKAEKVAAPVAVNPVVPDPKKGAAVPAPVPAQPLKDQKKGVAAPLPVKPVPVAELPKKALPLPTMTPLKKTEDGDDVQMSFNPSKIQKKARPESSRYWSKERRVTEQAYYTELKSSVRTLLLSLVGKVQDLFEDLHS